MAEPQKADLSHLPDPPTEYCVDGHTTKSLTDKYKLNELKGLLTYHGYGFEFTEPRTKLDTFFLFRKLQYHRRAIEGTVIGGVDDRGQLVCRGNVGPATLHPDIRRRYGLPNWLLTGDNAISFIGPHQWLQDRTGPRPGPKDVLTSFSGSPSISHTQSVPNPISMLEEHDGNNERRVSNPTVTQNPFSASVSKNRVESAEFGVVKTPTSSEQDVTSQRRERIASGVSEPFTPVNGPSNLHPTTTSTEKENEGARQIKLSDIIVAAESLTRHFPYEKLRLHRKATIRPQLTARSRAELTKAFVTAFPANSQASLVGDINSRFEFSADYDRKNGIKEAKVYPLRGRGPVYSKNSCYVDSVMASCLLLKAGLTEADWGGNDDWDEQLPPIQKYFYDSLHKSWNFYEDPISQSERDAFRRFYVQHYNREASGKGCLTETERGSPVALWNYVTSSFGQFHFTTRKRTTRCACQGGKVVSLEPGARQRAYIEPSNSSESNNTASIESSFEQYFHRRSKCPICKQETHLTEQVVTDDLPLRLVSQAIPSDKAILRGHTSPGFSFKYPRALGAAAIANSKSTSVQKMSFRYETARYRWLGGIYGFRANTDMIHYVVIWGDDDRHGASSAQSQGKSDNPYNTVSFYDGIQLSGSIIGKCNVEHGNPSERVPPKFLQEVPPLLFYERIIDSDKETIDANGRVVNILQPTRQASQSEFRPGSIAKETSRRRTTQFDTSETFPNARPLSKSLGFPATPTNQNKPVDLTGSHQNQYISLENGTAFKNSRPEPDNSESNTSDAFRAPKSSDGAKRKLDETTTLDSPEDWESSGSGKKSKTAKDEAQSDPNGTIEIND
ncbi:MAG: hypothetical protein Q9227_009389 [Pyrenula ochraceoflavens]